MVTVPEAPARTKVEIVYNTHDLEFHYGPQESVRVLLHHARERFKVPADFPTALFDTNGRELPEDETLRQAGIEPGARLVMRQATVRGG